MSYERAGADCYLGNPAPSGVDYVWHHDLTDIPGGQKCAECGTLFLTKKAKQQAKIHLQALKDLGMEIQVVGV